jgi:hypothetical protein
MNLFDCAERFSCAGKVNEEDAINLAIHLTSFQVAQLPFCMADWSNLTNIDPPFFKIFLAVLIQEARFVRTISLGDRQ